MWESIVNYLGEHYPFILIILAVVFIVWKVAKFYYSRFKPVEKKTSDLDVKIKEYDRISHCQQHAISESKHENDISEIKNILAYLRGKFDAFDAGASKLTQAHSPVSLTELGRNVANELDAESIIQNNWDVIFRMLEDNVKDKNAYDIQQYCIERAFVDIDKFFKEEDVLKLKNYAYKKGQPLQPYTDVIGVLIRDAYMLQKGIDANDIDANDPKNAAK